MIAADKIELVIAAAGQPARHHRIGQPGAPAALDPHPCEHLRDTERDAADRQVPDIDAVLEADTADDQDQKPDRKYPRQPVAVLSPKSPGADPEARQQI